MEIRFKTETKEERLRGEELARNSVENQGAKALGDWIIRNGVWPGRKKSCGKSFGCLLNKFGFRKLLPQYGRDGKSWDKILESSKLRNYFIKVKVKHPRKAPAGSVIVFNENVIESSGKRRILWSYEN